MKQCLLKASGIFCLEKRKVYKGVSFLAITFAPRMTDLAEDVRKQLLQIVKNCVAIAHDENIDASNTAQCAVFTRCVDYSLTVTEESLSSTERH